MCGKAIWRYFGNREKLGRHWGQQQGPISGQSCWRIKQITYGECSTPTSCLLWQSMWHEQLYRNDIEKKCFEISSINWHRFCKRTLQELECWLDCAKAASWHFPCLSQPWKFDDSTPRLLRLAGAKIPDLATALQVFDAEGSHPIVILLYYMR